MVYDEINRVAREGVPKDEVERVQTDYLRKRTFALVPTAARALVFDEFLTVYGGLEAVNGWEKRVRRVGSDDLKRVARKYLTPANRTVMMVVPGGKP
jgi:zinc protease